MYEAIALIPKFWISLINMFSEHKLTFQIGASTYDVSYFMIVAVMLIIGFAISIYWKGAKS